MNSHKVDVVIADAGQGAIEAKIVAVRRTGATRRAEILLPVARETIEIDAPAAISFSLGEMIPIRFIRGKIFPEATAGGAAA